MALVRPGNEAKLASFPGSKAKVKQPLRCISLICSYMRTFPIIVHYKVIKILEVRWLGTKVMQIFKETGGLIRSENEARILYIVEKRLYFAV